MSNYATLIPVNILTGALGSGKTSLLQRLLLAPQLNDTVVLVNEIGEIGIDHHLVAQATESTLLLENGCLCCTMRDDLSAALRDLHSRRDRGEIPRYKRVVLETTGIADPVPIAYTLIAEPVVRHHYRLGNVVTVVDAINASSQLDRFEESVRQVALADRLVLSKTDLLDQADIAPLVARLKALNPSASLVTNHSEALDPVELLVSDTYDKEGKAEEVSRWLKQFASDTRSAHIHHASPIDTYCIAFEEQLDWTAFGIWMTLLLHCHGDRVLRIKGLLNVAGVAGPVLVNGVQHVVHPPTHLESWPDENRQSRLVVILAGLDRSEIERSLAVFNALGKGGQSSTTALRSAQVRRPN